MEVHHILRKLRRDKDLTQQNVADELGIDITTYNRYEKDASSIQVDMLQKIAAFYKMSMSDLLSYTDRPGLLEEPKFEFVKKRTVTVQVELDGRETTVDQWVETLKKVNAALA